MPMVARTPGFSLAVATTRREFSRPMPTLMIKATPASRARRSTASWSGWISGRSKWAWVSARRMVISYVYGRIWVYMLKYLKIRRAARRGGGCQDFGLFFGLLDMVGDAAGLRGMVPSHPPTG